MTVDDPDFWLALVQIIWIDLLLSGDNAVVIALACRKLPLEQRVWGIALGTLVAIGLRIGFTGAVTTLMTMPYLKLIGGVLLIWIAIKLIGGEEGNGDEEVKSSTNIWQAVKIIAIADAVMSLDNVIAIAMAARGSYAASHDWSCDQHSADHGGRSNRYGPVGAISVIVWAGGVILGWIAGEIIAKDPLIAAYIEPSMAHTVSTIGAVLGAVFVLAVGMLRRRRLRREAPDEV